MTYANLVHSAYGEALEDDPAQRDADLLNAEIEKNGWYDVPEIKDGVSSPEWFETQPEIEF